MGQDASTASDDEARQTLVGGEVTGIFFLHDFLEIHTAGAILTGLTTPTGQIGGQPVEPRTLVSLIGRQITDLKHDTGVAVRLVLGADSVTFPVVGPTAFGPESVRLVSAGQYELGRRSATWIW